VNQNTTYAAPSPTHTTYLGFWRTLQVVWIILLLKLALLSHLLNTLHPRCMVTHYINNTYRVQR